MDKQSLALYDFGYHSFCGEFRDNLYTLFLFPQLFRFGLGQLYVYFLFPRASNSD